MKRSVFLRAMDPEVQAGKMTALEQEMLRLTLMANPDASLFQALTDVYDYLGRKVSKAVMQAVAVRLELGAKQPGAGAVEEAKEQAKEVKGKQSDFGSKFITWVESLTADQRVLIACGYDVEKARKIYCEEDFMLADEVVELWFWKSWQDAVLQLEAAAAPWSGGSSTGSSKGGDYTEYDMTQEAEDSPLWGELQACFG